MNAFVLLRVSAIGVEETVAALAERTGFLGAEELPVDGDTLFRVEEARSIVEFGTVGARKFSEWLATEQYRDSADVLLKAYASVASEQELNRWVRDLRQSHDVVASGILPEEDYTRRWREHYHGQNIGKSLWIGPPWEKPPAKRTGILIDPGMAFGTGDHATTRMCLEWMEHLCRQGFAPRRVFDIGTGSGVLAIAAAKLFPKCELWLCDLDPLCRKNAARNFALNKLTGFRRRAFWGKPLDAIRAPSGAFDLVLSNIYLEVLETLIAPVGKLLAGDGRWVVSGILDGKQEQEFVAATRHLRCCRMRWRRREGWVAACLTVPGHAKVEPS